MAEKHDEIKALVKRVIKIGLAENVGIQKVTFAREDLYINKAEDGSMKISLPRLRKAYVVLSGRVYEREYVDDAARAVEVIEQQPSIVTQLNYKGEPEKVDTAIFLNRLICSCGGVRYVKNADRFQVTKCKPCTIKDRNTRRQTRKHDLGGETGESC